MPGLWNDLDFSAAKKPVTLGAVRQYVRRGNGNTTRVTLDRFGYNVEKIPRYVATRCRSLNYLKITGGFIGASILEAFPYMSNLRTLVISEACEVSCDMVGQLLRHCLRLERAEFQRVRSERSRPVLWGTDMPNLRTLILDTQPDARQFGYPKLDLDQLLSKIPNIQTLSVQGWFIVDFIDMDFSKHVQLQDLNISRIRAPLPPRLPPSIRMFTMTNCYRIIESPEVEFKDFNLPRLTQLSLAGYPGLQFEDVQACLEPNKGKLTHLNIGDVVGLSSANLGELITQGYLERVEDLVLKSCIVDDHIAMLIAKNLLYLKKLDLGCSKITGVGVKALVTGLGARLEYLCLDECHYTNIDAVIFARAKGVKVAFGFQDSARGGKKIIQR